LRTAKIRNPAATGSKMAIAIIPSANFLPPYVCFLSH
jgi:hypothetical protein